MKIKVLLSESEGSISQFWDTVEKGNLELSFLSLISKISCCHGSVILWCVVQIFIFGIVGSVSKV